MQAAAVVTDDVADLSILFPFATFSYFAYVPRAPTQHSSLASSRICHVGPSHAVKKTKRLVPDGFPLVTVVTWSTGQVRHFVTFSFPLLAELQWTRELDKANPLLQVFGQHQVNLRCVAINHKLRHRCGFVNNIAIFKYRRNINFFTRQTNHEVEGMRNKQRVLSTVLGQLIIFG
jgi:hypothetical protein